MLRKYMARESKASTMEQENEGLRLSVAAAQQVAADLRSTLQAQEEQTRVAVEEARADAQTKIADLKSSLTKTQSKYNRLQKDNERLEEENNKLQESYRELMTEYVKSQSEIDKLREENARAKMEVATVEASAQVLACKVEQECDALRSAHLACDLKVTIQRTW